MIIHSGKGKCDVYKRGNLRDVADIGLEKCVAR